MRLLNILSSMAGIDIGGREVSADNPLPGTNVPFIVTLEITRPANTTQYTARDIINANAATTLPRFDLSAYGANRILVVSGLSIMSNNGSVAAASRLTCDAKLYAVNNPIADCSDNGAFAPTYDAAKNRKTGFSAVDCETLPDLGPNAYMAALWENKQKFARTDAGGYIYLAVLAANAYTPASGEKFNAVLTGFVQ